MLKRTISYTDYDGNERTEDFYFNLTKAELLQMQLGTAGGLKAALQKMVETNDMPRIMSTFKSIVRSAYGEKSLDGRRFMKSEELSDAFEQTEAYAQLFFELATKDGAAAAFVNGILPQNLDEDANQPVLPQRAF